MFTQPFRQQFQLSNSEAAYYGGLFQSLDSDSTGLVSKETLAEFMKSSGLGEDVLYRLWGLVDISEQGKFNQDLFAKICRLIGHAQADGTSDIFPELLYVVPKKLPVFFNRDASGAQAFPRKDPDEQIYMSIFEKLRVGSIVPPEVVRRLFIKSGVAEKDLAKIFDLATTETQGIMGYGEFILCMTLISRCRKGLGIPESLSPDLVELTHRPTPGSGTDTHSRQREEILSYLETEQKLAVTETAVAKVRDSQYYQLFDEMKKLETALTVAETVTSSWQDQILSCQGRLGEIENELEDFDVPEKSDNDFSELEHQLNDLLTELEKLNRTKTDLRSRVQVLRERVNQRINDADILSATLSSESTKLSQLRKERVKLIEISNPLSAPKLPSRSHEDPFNSPATLRRDAKGVRIGVPPQQTGTFVVSASQNSFTPGGWESFESVHPQGVIGLPTFRTL